MKNTHLTRRQTLQAGAASVVAAHVLPSRVLGLDGATAPSDKPKVGVIGLGGRARGLVGYEAMPVTDMQLTAVCDCFEPRVGAFVKHIQGINKDLKLGAYTDFRKMIEQEKLDAVMVETTTHARAWIAVQAMQMGMDAYLEKPMCLTISEGRYMVDAARKYKRVTQVGTQQRSMPLNNWASDLVKDGKLGKIKAVLAPNFVGPDYWQGGPEQPMPKTSDDKWWGIWTNQAEMRPYNNQLHYGWDRWYSYDGGGRCFGVTGWGTHSYDQIQRALGTDETGPVEIVLKEPVENRPTGRFEERRTGDDETGAPYYKMAKLSGPRAKIRMKYANGTELRLELDGDRGPGLGAIFVGTEGKMEINRNKIAANPKELLSLPGNPGPRPAGQHESTAHVQNWVDCIKSRERCNADIEYGQRSSSLCYLVNIAREIGRVGFALKWDPETERFTNCPEANKSLMIDRPRREGYELPKLV